MDKWCLIPEAANYIAMLKMEVDFGWIEKRCPLRRDVGGLILDIVFYNYQKTSKLHATVEHRPQGSLVYHGLLNVFGMNNS